MFTEEMHLEASGEVRAKQFRGFGALFQSSLRFIEALVSLVLRHAMPLTHILG